ncbi:uncharacterized protein LOC124289590 isoform X2 [Haliotis rubra]|uniref:uncharacterized protein LOC124289590 isoform X2 n=1 Tax=Haliotis rubra TaxID=36100 RepID=UPI001EE50BFE|nr:uncharacterized protein LOC124289590 isoform X2 [Haliotis rubra]
MKVPAGSNTGATVQMSVDCSPDIQGTSAVKGDGPQPVHRSSIGQCRCRCAHARLQNFLLPLTLGIAVLGLLVAARANFREVSTCRLSAEDKLLLQKLQSFNTPHKGEDEETEEIDLSPQEFLTSHSQQINDVVEDDVGGDTVGGLSLLHRVARAAGTTAAPRRKSKKSKRRRKSKSKSKSIRAAHYIPKFWKDRTEEEFGRDTMCISVAKWGGRACRNRTLEMKSGSMKFFHPADWVARNRHINMPATQDEDSGKFTITESGLYLLYSSVSASILFYDSKLKQSQAIIKNGQRLFKCMEGVDYINMTAGKTFNSKYRTCSNSGVTYLEKGDVISVDLLYDNTVLDLSEDSTFFGLVQLLPGPKKKKSRS